MRQQSHVTLCSFVFSVLLTSAFVPSGGDVALASAGAPAVQMAVQSVLNGLRAQGLAGGADLAFPAPGDRSGTPDATTPDAGSTLTSQILEKMLQLIVLKGKDQDIAASFAGPLGLVAAGQNWPERQIATKSGSDGSIHGFAVGRGDDQNLVVYTRRADALHIFRVTREGKAVAALVSDAKTGVIAIRALAEAQAEVDEEFSLWAKGVDKLLGK